MQLLISLRVKVKVFTVPYKTYAVWLPITSLSSFLPFFPLLTLAATTAFLLFLKCNIGFPALETLNLWSLSLESFSLRLPLFQILLQSFLLNVYPDPCISNCNPPPSSFTTCLTLNQPTNLIHWKKFICLVSKIVLKHK